VYAKIIFTCNKAFLSTFFIACFTTSISVIISLCFCYAKIKTILQLHVYNHKRWTLLSLYLSTILNPGHGQVCFNTIIPATSVTDSMVSNNKAIVYSLQVESFYQLAPPLFLHKHQIFEENQIFIKC
jgi:hypothetical protein